MLFKGVRAICMKNKSSSSNHKKIMGQVNEYLPLLKRSIE
jgi:hypothetical protein